MMQNICKEYLTKNLCNFYKPIINKTLCNGTSKLETQRCVAKYRTLNDPLPSQIICKSKIKVKRKISKTERNALTLSIIRNYN